MFGNSQVAPSGASLAEVARRHMSRTVDPSKRNDEVFRLQRLSDLLGWSQRELAGQLGARSDGDPRALWFLLLASAASSRPSPVAGDGTEATMRQLATLLSERRLLSAKLAERSPAVQYAVSR